MQLTLFEDFEEEICGPEQEREHKLAYWRNYYVDHRLHYKEMRSTRYDTLHEEMKADARENYWKNRDAVLTYKKQKYDDPIWRADRLAYFAEHRQREDVKLYRKNFMREWQRQKRATDPSFRITASIRSRIKSALDRHGAGKKYADTTSLIGCSVPQLVAHLESQFEPWMTWEHYGFTGLKKYGVAWVIDHIIPCASFNMEDPEDQKKCFSYSNMAPLGMIENIKKGKRLDWPVRGIVESLAYAINTADDIGEAAILDTLADEDSVECADNMVIQCP